jgi:hypothetical protein
MTTTTETPKPKRRPRRGPPGVKCGDCGKLAGAQDEGEIQDYSADVSGAMEGADITLDARLVLSTACCGSEFKSYDLTDNEFHVDHECPKAAELEAAEQAWNEHCDRDGEGVPNCHEARAGRDACTASGPGKECEDGQKLHRAVADLNAEIDDSGEDWEVEEDGENDAEPYQRSQTTTTVRRKTKAGVKLITKPISNHRYAKSFLGFTTTITVKHALCGETEDQVIAEGDVELGAGDFEPLT